MNMTIATKGQDQPVDSAPETTQATQTTTSMTVSTANAVTTMTTTVQASAVVVSAVIVEGGCVDEVPNDSGGGDEKPNAAEIRTRDDDEDGGDADDTVEPPFPVEQLAALDEKISSARWVVPVLQNQELECLMKCAIDMCRNGTDHRSSMCQRFFREGLTTSFTKILTDDAVLSWKQNIHQCINNNCLRLIELCVLKLPHDWYPLLDLLAMVLNPNCKFHTFNAGRPSESLAFFNQQASAAAAAAATVAAATPAVSNGSPNTLPASTDTATQDVPEIYGRWMGMDVRNSRGWLVDLINRFGELGGFTILHERFKSNKNLNLAIVYSLLRPFGLCYQYLTPHAINKYFVPILATIPSILDKLSDDELKREAKAEMKGGDIVSAIIKSAKNLAMRTPNHEELMRTLEGFRLKMILRQLQISSFNGKMMALNEINKVISSVSYYPNRHHSIDEEEYLTSERMAAWINENKVLEIVLRDSLHQPQYVEKLEKILRFVIKERALSLQDLDAVWMAQVGKHEAIVKNVHDLLAKLAWDFSAEQLDHLFECFQSSWTSASRRQRERLLELIRRLAEDDKDGVMALKVLSLFWTLAHSEDAPTEIIDQALAAHVKILDYSCSQERDAQKTIWLDKCVEELKENRWVLPALKQIREICCLYEPAQQQIPQHPQRLGPGSTHIHGSHHMVYRQQVIERLQHLHTLVVLVTNSLTVYMKTLREEVNNHLTSNVGPALTCDTYIPDNRYPHTYQVQERLNFLRFLLREGQLWLCAEQAKQIWKCLAENAVFVSDRESCFKWFSKLMCDEPDLDPNINKDFFEQNILLMDPALLTESGIKCFERFFKAVNTKEGKLREKHRTLLTEDPDLIGLDYLWKVVTVCSDDIAARAVDLLREVSTNLGPRLVGSQLEFHENYITSCYERLNAHYETIIALQRSSGSTDANTSGSNANKNNDKDLIVEQSLQTRIRSEAVKLCRILHVLHEYMAECDANYTGTSDRRILPLHRACRGKNMCLIVRFSSANNRQIEEMDIPTHSNDTLASLRKAISRRIKSSEHFRVELLLNNEPLDFTNDHKLLSEIPIRDNTIVTAKMTQINLNMASSQDSSSDSSTNSPQHPYECPTSSGCAPGGESILPGVIMSRNPIYAKFFCQLSTLGSQLQYTPLRDGARALLQLMPCDTAAVLRLRCMFMSALQQQSNPQLVQRHTTGSGTDLTTVESLFFSASPSEVLYNLEILYALLMPAQETLSDHTLHIQFGFLASGEAHTFLEMFTKNNFMSRADCATRRSAYQVVLKVCKLILTAVAHVLLRLAGEQNQDAASSGGQATTRNNMTPDMWLRQAVYFEPCPFENILRQVSSKLCTPLADLMLMDNPDSHVAGQAHVLFNMAVNWSLPEVSTITALVRLIWAASSANLQSLNASGEQLHSLCDPAKRNAPLLLHLDDVLLCKEAIEVLTISFILNPSALDKLCRDSDISQDTVSNLQFSLFVIDLVLLNPNRMVRISAAEQFLAMCTNGASSSKALLLIAPLMFSLLETTVPENARTAHEFFQLLCRLVKASFVMGHQFPQAEKLLANEVNWLRQARGHHDTLIEGHLFLTRELLNFISSEQKCELGSTDCGSLIRELVEDFLFPASKLALQLQKNDRLGEDPATPICETPQTQAAAFDLLYALCVNCVPNCRQLVVMLSEMFYSDNDTVIHEWDYLPAIGPRPMQGFVGLKNAGATCYMNSVLQQLFMVRSIREGLLSCEGAATDVKEDFSGEEHSELSSNNEVISNLDGSSSEETKEKNSDYNVGILKQIQAIFGHLACSRLQYYVPRGLWMHFKLQGEPVNLREQQDAVEFFMALVESLDEALKLLGLEQIMNKILGGSYSDQKICRGCPHRYSKEEPFSVISVDIRNHSSLQDSMEQYVKGELLEGADAYHCDKCNKKVVTVKRLCVKKLPPILAIQLKRFEYDFERVCAMKFNDYFEFPRNLDMEPYTVSGLAKLEGEVIDCEQDDKPFSVCTTYKLSGIVVHSGQASGGHYYSYIRSQEPSPQAYLNLFADNIDSSSINSTWFKFDDGEVTECRMNDDDELKVQCFGGDYMAEVFDPVQKRTTYRRQKRWWNAYMLFYTREDVEKSDLEMRLDKLKIGDPKDLLTKMPAAIENSIRKQNIKFLHHRNQFSLEYFNFIRKLVSVHRSKVYDGVSSPINASRSASGGVAINSADHLSMLSTQLASRFLFHTGWHTKKSLRGPAMEWCDLLCEQLRFSVTTRAWFANQMLFAHPQRFCEYLLSCPSSEVRIAFMRIVVRLAHFSISDPCPVCTVPMPVLPPTVHSSSPLVDSFTVDPNGTLSDHILMALLTLLMRDVADHGRQLMNYCNVFHMYANLGLKEKEQLLNLNVHVKFMLVALDEGPGPVIKYQYTEHHGKLNQVVTCLVRCCAVSSRCSSSTNQAVLPNPYRDMTCSDYITPLSPQATELLFTKTSYIKKVIDDASGLEESVKLLQFCAWENPHFSHVVLSELLFHISHTYQELRHHMDMLLAVLLIEDSWQTHRIHNAILGIPDEREGLLERIARSKDHYQKYAYLCIKFLVTLFSRCRLMAGVMREHAEMRRQWNQAVIWLQDELERRYQNNSQYTYNSWSPPAKSNDSSNGYVLERSNSARKVLERAKELFVDQSKPAIVQQQIQPSGGQTSSPLPPSQPNVPSTPSAATPSTTGSADSGVGTSSPPLASSSPQVPTAATAATATSAAAARPEKHASTEEDISYDFPEHSAVMTSASTTSATSPVSTYPSSSSIEDPLTVISNSTAEQQIQSQTAPPPNLSDDAPLSGTIVHSSSVGTETTSLSEVGVSVLTIAAPPPLVTTPTSAPESE